MANVEPALPDDALVVRGGMNLPESFVVGSGVVIDASRLLKGASVNCGAGCSVQELTAPNMQAGYRGIPHSQIGVTTVGAIRAAGAIIAPSPKPWNPYHTTVGGLTPEQVSLLFRPTRKNPNRR